MATVEPLDDDGGVVDNSAVPAVGLPVGYDTVPAKTTTSPSVHSKVSSSAHETAVSFVRGRGRRSPGVDGMMEAWHRAAALGCPRGGVSPVRMRCLCIRGVWEDTFLLILLSLQPKKKKNCFTISTTTMKKMGEVPNPNLFTMGKILISASAKK